MEPPIMQGKVTKIEYTHGPFGNQYTSINGTRYATWWDVATTPVRKGATVEYSVRKRTHTLNGVAYEFTEAVIKRVL